MPAVSARIVLDSCHSDESNRKVSLFVVRSAEPSIAAHEVANRPGRIEPRVLKRRRHRYSLMRRPHAELQAELGKT